MYLKPNELDKHIRRKPSVQQICVGAYLQQSMFVTADILAVPLSAVGYEGIGKLVGEYVSADLDIYITVKEVRELIEKEKDAYPSIVLVWHPVHDSSTEELVNSSSKSFARAHKAISWVTGDRFEVVANIVLHENGQKFELSPPKSRRRQRLWFSLQEAKNFEENVVHLAEIAETDSRLSLALQLYLDAINDRSEEFRLVKLYNALECLASEYKRNGVGSRDAIRKLLGIKPGQHCSIEHNGKNIKFDLISVAGLIRDKIMHGAKIKKESFAQNDRDVFDILAFAPFKLAHELNITIDSYFMSIPNKDKGTVKYRGTKLEKA